MARGRRPRRSSPAATLNVCARLPRQIVEPEMQSPRPRACLFRDQEQCRDCWLRVVQRAMPLPRSTEAAENPPAHSPSPEMRAQGFHSAFGLHAMVGRRTHPARAGAALRRTSSQDICHANAMRIAASPKAHVTAIALPRTHGRSDAGARRAPPAKALNALSAGSLPFSKHQECYACHKQDNAHGASRQHVPHQLPRGASATPARCTLRA